MLQLPGWSPVKTRMDQRWRRVRNAAVAPIPKAGKTPESIHTWAVGNIRYKLEATDAWATPAETLARGYGDCEDFALLERALLQAAGYPGELWMLIAWDLVARQDHALLIAGETILDCRTPKVLPLASFSDYRPTIAFSGDSAVTFGRRV